MADIHDLRRLALALPGAHEVTYKGAPWFNVGKKTFALAPSDKASAGRVILKLDRAHQELLFEVRPETFQPCKVATVHWSYVALGDVDEAELAALVREAWAQIVPKAVSRALLNAARDA
ncbi:MAG: MmcQ/YjbR family DNA-binding protein [Alphaproteobacteria bacterium]|nr:MmcQ/YjbR family DNA-binding protein [Alphaproteobacteria bacterium]MBU1513191.1 MmcQ/YjbR family DNA-binding protein [Alphaproteobacteria bacterium]MBU2095299.1 MmcQ/YjbR family DNA-binding protein [Alphaproteobacteria bacterium]MBU2152214.1 MmcQ/YjbR family DNA-binding protein [Alphaproteobacteria bacterium]MBU2306739.1 MmcQ/YjbR family DNA-binding protein [Alphaproteobacteria bacterium]